MFLWDVSTGNTLRRISGHMSKINVVEFNADATVVASGEPTRTSHTEFKHAYDSVRFVRFNREAVGPSVCDDAFNAAYNVLHLLLLSAQNRQAIQTLEEARDSVQTLYVGATIVMSGSVDGHVRTYDLRKGELRADVSAISDSAGDRDDSGVGAQCQRCGASVLSLYVFALLPGSLRLGRGEL